VVKGVNRLGVIVTVILGTEDHLPTTPVEEQMDTSGKHHSSISI
jgi:hypothetical protein